MQNKSQQISALIEQNDALENYFSNTIIPQLFVDADFVLRKFTPPAMKQFKLHPTDIGKSLADIQDNFRFPSIIENIQAVIDNGQALEKEIQTTDMRWYQMNILPYRIQKENTNNGVIITFVDITSRIRDLKEQERLVLEYELLLDTISHDVKTPLTSLSLTVEMLKKVLPEGSEKLPALIIKLDSGLLKIRDIISDLTESRDSDEHYQAASELLDIEQILEEVRLNLAPQLIESKGSLNWQVDHAEISFVRRKLRSILYNLVNNAIKYRDAKRKLIINVKVYDEDNFIVIAVEDNGIGIAAEHLKTIFNKYQRVAKNVDGTGVGLHLVKEIVNRAGGKIIIDSEEGKGSVFKVCLQNIKHHAD